MASVTLFLTFQKSLYVFWGNFSKKPTYTPICLKAGASDLHTKMRTWWAESIKLCAFTNFCNMKDTYSF